MSQRDTSFLEGALNSKARSTMSGAPSWQKVFNEGLKHFRRQEIDEALESFNQVKGDSLFLGHGQMSS
jgi:hypothetical protein